MAAATPLTAVDLAASAVESQRRLLADARRLSTNTAEARLDAEHEVAKLVRRETGAVQASASDRANLELAGELTLARTQLEHARADLAAAVQADEEASARVVATEARLLEAGRALEAAELLETISDGTHEAAAAEIAKVIVGSIVALGNAIERHRAMLESDGALVRRLHELGAGPDVAERDGSALAGFVARELIGAGGRAAHPLTGNVYSLRYELDRPSATSTGTAPAVMRLAEIILNAIEQGRRDAAAGHPDRGLGTLRDIESWQSCRSSLDVRGLTESRDRARVQDKAAADKASHEKRLATSKAKADAQRGRSVMSIALSTPQRTSGAAEAPGKDQVIPLRPASPVPLPIPPELQGDVPGGAPAPAPRSSGNPYVPDVAGDYALPGSADAPGGNPFPVAPVAGTPTNGMAITYSPDRRSRDGRV